MATDQQFCLRWNNHQSTLISVFDSLLENGTLVDCTLAAEGKYLKAHKVVLSACSPYLETLLSQHYEKHPIVILKDVKFTELKSMMDYMYRGEVNISQDQLGTFLKAAESLQIKGLSDNGDDATGPTTKRQEASARPSVTEVRNVETKRPAPSADLSDASREGSISPSSLRKRRRTRRSSQGDDPDSHLDSTSNACDFPINTSQTTTPLSVPSTTVVPTPVQNLPKQIVKQEPSISRIDNLNSTIAPESGLLKEKIEPPSEPLLEPKTEYLDYMNNENSIEVEDLTLDDDEDLDSSMDASRPGPSHGDMSNQGYQWPMGDQSGTDEIFMAAQQAVGAATGQQRDSQDGFIRSSHSSLEENVHHVPATYNPAVITPSNVKGKSFISVEDNIDPADLQIVSTSSLSPLEVINFGFGENTKNRIRVRDAATLMEPVLSLRKIDGTFMELMEQEPLNKTVDEQRLSIESDIQNVKTGKRRPGRPRKTQGIQNTRNGISNTNNVKSTRRSRRLELMGSTSSEVNESSNNSKSDLTICLKKENNSKYINAQSTTWSIRRGDQSPTLNCTKSPVEVMSKNNVSKDDKNTYESENEEKFSHTSLKIKTEKKKHRRNNSYRLPDQHQKFNCDQCGRKYMYLRGLRQHIKLECNKQPQFPCPFCPRMYRYRSGIRDHVLKAHELAFPRWYANHFNTARTRASPIKLNEPGVTSL